MTQRMCLQWLQSLGLLALRLWTVVKLSGLVMIGALQLCVMLW